MDAASWDIPFGGVSEADQLLRRDWWRARRVREASERERAAVDAARAKTPAESSPEDWTTLSYSPFGTGQGCGCRRAV